MRNPEDHLLTRAGEHHVFRIELNALYRVRVLRVQHGHFVAFLHVPNVNLAVRRAAENELRVGRERRFQWNASRIRLTLF